MESGQGAEEEESARTALGLADLLESHSAVTIIAWLSVSAGKKRDGTGKSSTIIDKLKRFQHLRPHFATNFTDFLHEDCKHLLGVEEPPAAPSAPAAADPPAAAGERGPGARRRLPVDPAPIQVRRSDRPAPAPAPRAEASSEGRHHHHRGGGGRGRRTARPATDPRPTAGARHVPLSDLMVSSETRPARRGRRSFGGRSARPVSPERPTAVSEPRPAAGAGRWEKLNSRLGSAGESGGGPEPRRTALAAAPASAGPAEDAGFVTPVKQLIRRDTAAGSPASATIAAALPGSVTGAERLAQLATLYAHLIEHNLLLGLSIELNFLVRLLVTPGGDDQPPAESRFLTTVHNAVYFSVRTLWLLHDQLVFLDAANLRLLATNERLVSFQPELADVLLELPARRPCVSPPPGAAASAGDERPDSLAFYAELVYRPNFPSDASFNAFRRQHDLFHGLVERWRTAVAAGGSWDAEAALGDEPRALVSLCPHPVNMHHLARLYQAQLLLLAGDGAAGGSGTESAALLLQADRTRLQRLNDRFLKPMCVGRAGGRRDFPGAEELFRQLLVRADSAEFSAALRDLLASSVLQLDGQTLHLPDTGVLPSTVQEVSDRIFRLRLLAKFLGLVTFRGLHSDGEIPEQVLTSSIQMRNRLPPPLDLLSCLEGAVRRRQLITTLPWIIEYICMMDRVSVLTSAHQTVFSLLVAVFRSLSRAAGLTRHNALFLRLQYENLYEIHSHVQNLCEKDDLAAMDRRRMDQLVAEFGRLYLCRDGGREGGRQPAPPAADASDLVRPSLFYVCCPYLTEQKVALLQFRAGRSYQPSPALRKIIPISAQPVDAVTVAARRTQSELEEGFFQSHHPSLRRSTAFVVERLASALIKLLRGSHLSAVTAPLLQPLLRQLAERLRRGDQDYQIKSWLPARLSGVVLAQHAAVVSQLAAECRRRVTPLVSDALGALLVGEELTEGARRIVHRLAEAGVLSRVNCWLNTNVTRDFVQHVMEEECRAELRRLRRAALSPSSPSAGPPSVDSPLLPAPLGDLPDAAAAVHSPSQCLMDVKNVVCGVLSGARHPSGRELGSLLVRMTAVYAQWARLLPSTARCLQQLSGELVIALACGRPELLAPAAAQRAVLRCWAALAVDPAAQLLARPARQRVAASRQPTAAAGCLRRLLAAAGGTEQQLAQLDGADNSQQQQPQRRRAAAVSAAITPRRKASGPTLTPAVDKLVPQKTAPEDPAPGEPRRNDSAAEDVGLEDIAAEDTTLEDPTSEDTTLEDPGPEDDAPQRDTAPRGVTPIENVTPEEAVLVTNCWRRRPPLLQLS